MPTDLHYPRRYRLWTMGEFGCYDVLSLGSYVTYVPDANVGATLSYTYDGAEHWLLFNGGDGVYILQGNGSIHGPLTTESTISSGKIVSDGTTVWAAWMEQTEIGNPWYAGYQTYPPVSLTLCEDDPTWDPYRLVIVAGDSGGFSEIGSSEAEFFNSTAGTALGGPWGGAIGKVEGCASVNEPGVAYFCWSEGGFTGSAHRSGCDPTPCFDEQAPGPCTPPATDVVYAHPDTCGGGWGPDFLPNGFSCITTFPGCPGPWNQCAIQDYNWMGERFLILKCDDGAVLWENADRRFVLSAVTENYGDDFGDNGNAFINGDTAVTSVLRMVNEHGSPALFVGWMDTVYHDAVGLDVRPAEIEYLDIDPTDGTTSVLQTLTLAETTGIPGGSKILNIGISDKIWADPVDASDVYYLSTRWTGSRHNIHRLATDGATDFDWIDGVESLSDVTIGSFTGPPATVMVEMNNIWLWASSSSVLRLRRQCLSPVWEELPSFAGPATEEVTLIGDAIYGGGSTTIDFAGHLSIEYANICRCCVPCPTLTPGHLYMRIDGVEEGPFVLDIQPTGLTSFRLGGGFGGGVGNQYFDNFKVGTTGWGSSNIFSADFAATIVPPFDSTSGVGISIDAGTLKVQNSSYSYAQAAVSVTGSFYISLDLRIDGTMWDAGGGSANLLRLYDGFGEFCDLSVDMSTPEFVIDAATVPTADPLRDTWQTIEFYFVV